MERVAAIAASLFSDRNLTRKAYLNSIAAGLDYVTRFGVAFVVTPFLVADLGPVLFGVWTIILRMTEYVHAGSRSSQALKWFVVKEQSSQEIDNKRRGVGAAVVAWLIFLPLQLAVGAGIVGFLPTWISIPDNHITVVRLAAALVVTGLVLRGLVEIPRSVLLGENLGYKRMWLSAALIVVGGTLTLAALHAGWGIVGVGAAMTGTAVLTGVAFLFVVRTYVPWFGISPPDRDTVRRFVGWSWWFMAWDLIVRLMSAVDVILLGILASPSLVTVYALVRYLPEGALRFITTLVYETAPGIGKLLSAGEHQRAAKMRGEVMLLTWLATTSVGATILLWNASFIQLWVGAQFGINAIGLLLIVLMIVQFVWIRADSNFINLTLDLRPKVVLGAVSAVLSIILAVAFTKLIAWPVVGVCLGMLVGRGILSISYPMILGRVLRVPLMSQVRAMVRPGMVTLVLFAAFAALGDEVRIHHWLGLGLVAPVTFMLMVMVAFISGLSAAQRQTVLHRIRLAMDNGGK